MEGVQCGTKLSNNCLLSMFILTVEDEFLISEYLRAILEGGGHKVIATFDAGEAIEVLERVCDIQLSSAILTCRAQWTGSGWPPQSETDGRRST